MPQIKVYLMLMLLAIAFSADSNDANPEISIRAEFSEQDLEAETTLYQGNVRLDHPNLSLTADRLKQFSLNGSIERIEVVGDPLVVINRIATKQGVRRGEAKSMVYFAQENKVLLKECTLFNDNGWQQHTKEKVVLLKSE